MFQHELHLKYKIVYAVFPPFQFKTTQCTGCNGFLNTFIIKKSFQGGKTSKWNTNGPSLHFSVVWLCTVQNTMPEAYTL